MVNVQQTEALFRHLGQSRANWKHHRRDEKILPIITVSYVWHKVLTTNSAFF